jgi:acyl carrier protein
MFSLVLGKHFGLDTYNQTTGIIMNKSEILNNLQNICRKVFADNNLIINDNLTANDVDAWDSLHHLTLITEIESFFSITLGISDVLEMENIGEVVRIIANKI